MCSKVLMTHRSFLNNSIRNLTYSCPTQQIKNMKTNSFKTWHLHIRCMLYTCRKLHPALPQLTNITSSDHSSYLVPQSCFSLCYKPLHTNLPNQRTLKLCRATFPQTNNFRDILYNDFGKTILVPSCKHVKYPFMRNLLCNHDSHMHVSSHVTRHPRARSTTPAFGHLSGIHAHQCLKIGRHSRRHWD